MKYNLIESIKKQSDVTETLYENVKETPVDTIALLEAADKFIGQIMAALKAGKNPFEVVPGSEAVLAGLIMLSKDTNREAVNMPSQKFSVVTQKLSQSKKIQDYVAKQAKSYVPSLINDLRAKATDRDQRVKLASELYALQQQYGQVKHKAKRDQEVRAVA